LCENKMNKVLEYTYINIIFIKYMGTESPQSGK
jgi:hypothetical protein